MPSRKHGHIWNLTLSTIQNQEKRNYKQQTWHWKTTQQGIQTVLLYEQH